MCPGNPENPRFLCMPKSHWNEINDIKELPLIKLKSNQGRALSPGNPENPRFPRMPKSCLTYINYLHIYEVPNEGPRRVCRVYFYTPSLKVYYGHKQHVRSPGILYTFCTFNAKNI